MGNNNAKRDILKVEDLFNDDDDDGAKTNAINKKPWSNN